ncbi:hypothetical protein O7598_17465 [Micromonospora sp. WMMC241]|nr:hypothetical protein [Micromonospora sp. WMMC241]MCZ7438203.1 hypothetical protein [Micromonospora sp. WMMC241]
MSPAHGTRPHAALPGVLTPFGVAAGCLIARRAGAGEVGTAAR